MKFYRIWALLERDLRKFFRSPALMMSSMVFPLMQLIVLGYAFGGKITNEVVGVVDQDHTAMSWQVRESFAATTTGPKMFHVVNYNSIPAAMEDLRSGAIGGIVEIPENFSRRTYQQDRPQLALIVDNSDQFVSSSLETQLQSIVDQFNAPVVPSNLPGQMSLEIVEVYPYIAYIKYLLPGVISLAIFVVAMIGGGITFIDDKARGLHEGYLVTPIHKAELVLGLNFAGMAKGVMAGLVLTFIGGLLAGIPRLWDPLRLLYLIVVVAITSLAMISFMFLVMVRVDDPLVPRAIFGVLNTLLYFPSGAIYPIAGFPVWLRALSIIDPFTYAVHALRNLLLRGSGLDGIYRDVLVLGGFSVIMISLSIALFKRQI